MSEYTPTTDEVREWYGHKNGSLYYNSLLTKSIKEFDRWLAAEMAKAKADALREFADFADDQDTAESARKYAEQIEEEAGI